MRLKQAILASVVLLIVVSTVPHLSAAYPADVQGSPATAAMLRLHLVYGDLAHPETTPAGVSFEETDLENQEVIHDPWLSFDKVQHFSFSLLITVGSQYTLVNKLAVRERSALPISMMTSATVGVAKELYDWQHGPRRYFSQRDMIANAAGILVAAGFILL